MKNWMKLHFFLKQSAKRWDQDSWTSSFHLHLLVGRKDALFYEWQVGKPFLWLSSFNLPKMHHSRKMMASIGNFSVAMVPLMSSKKVRIIIHKRTSENKWHDERTTSPRKTVWEQIKHDNKWSLNIKPICTVPAARSTGSAPPPPKIAGNKNLAVQGFSEAITKISSLVVHL